MLDSTKNPPSGISVTDACVHTQAAQISDEEISGNLVVSSMDSNRFSYLSLIRLGTKEAKALTLSGERSAFQAHISPDYKWLAYEKWLISDDSTDNLIIFSLTRGEEMSIPWKQDEWWIMGNWIDNEHLIIRNREEKKALILNPFTGSQPEMDLLEFPVAWRFEDLWVNQLNVSFSPDLTRVVYLRSDGIGLLDWETNEVLRVVSPNVESITPQWAPDSSQFIFAENLSKNPLQESLFRLVLATRDGNPTYVEPPSLLDLPHSFSWSPDSTRIAYWEGGVEANLHLLDVDGLWITNTCIESYGLLGSELNIPVWSPDGRFLAFQYLDPETRIPDHGKLVIMDLEEWVAFQFDEEYRPIGWLVE